MSRSALRLAAGTLVLALPFAGVAACGVEKKRTVSQELSSAQGFLENAKAASFTMRLDDSQGSLVKLMTADGEMPVALAKALTGGSITYTADAEGDAKLKSLSSTLDSTELKASLSKVNVAVVVRADKAEVFEMRLVAGDLFARVNLAEVGRLAEAGGAEDFDASLDAMLGGTDERFVQGLKDVRAGKWLKLPIGDYLDQLKDLAGSVVPGGIPTAAPQSEYAGLGTKLIDAVKPHIRVTDAGDSSSDRVLDVRVQARPAAKALLAVIEAEKSLPFAGMLGAVTPADIDKHLAAGEAKGRLHLKDGHLTQVAVDLESLRLLSTKPGTDSVAGLSFVLDIDDSAAAVTAPTELSSLDLGAILTDFLEAFTGGLGAGLEG